MNTCHRVDEDKPGSCLGSNPHSRRMQYGGHVTALWLHCLKWKARQYCSLWVVLSFWQVLYMIRLETVRSIRQEYEWWDIACIQEHKACLLPKKLKNVWFHSLSSKKSNAVYQRDCNCVLFLTALSRYPFNVLPICTQALRVLNKVLMTPLPRQTHHSGMHYTGCSNGRYTIPASYWRENKNILFSMLQNLSEVKGLYWLTLGEAMWKVATISSHTLVVYAIHRLRISLQYPDMCLEVKLKLIQHLQ